MLTMLDIYLSSRDAIKQHWVALVLTLAVGILNIVLVMLAISDYS